MRSGTTLMRVMLDAHPDINCGPENLLLYAMLELFQKALFNEVFFKILFFIVTVTKAD